MWRWPPIPGPIGKLLAPRGWRPQLVGCVATLVAPPGQRPVDELTAAASAYSWVSPQLVVTLSLLDPDTGWRRAVAVGALERDDAKAAAALATVSDEPSVRHLAGRDDEFGASIAADWSAGIRAAIEDAGITPDWLA